ncbi:hypothetical protein [Rubrobacter calidifluminis]|uniref:hypothetical protein n=1 Tax=Rubrobacter calidifluminis TaxID=1392640 RepID=UPI00235F1DAE|nr:hypothetical protein [Rubrobacter calidifluminis]
MVDEAGIALPLAIILIVLISVMGAGLLVFVNTDLTAVAQANEGQRAFDLADAGIQAARKQLASDPRPSDYDGLGSVSTGGESQWSWQTNGATNGVTLSNLYTGSGTPMNSVSVTIQNVSSDSGASTFRVISTGQYGNAKRRIEAIFRASGITNGLDIPQMVYVGKDTSMDRLALEGLPMYSSGTIDITQPTLILKNASMFSGGDIKLPTPSSGLSASVCASILGVRLQVQIGGGPGVTVSGTDPAGNWQNQYNATARKVNTPGMGAVGSIGYRDNMLCKPSGWRSSFFDKDSGPSLLDNLIDPLLNPILGGTTLKARFVDTPSTSPQPSKEITYPFNKTPDTAALTSDLKAVAQAQGKQYTVPAGASTSSISSASKGNYIEVSGGTHTVTFCDVAVPCGTSDLTLNWPAVSANTDPSEWPVIYVRFDNHSSNNVVNWNVLTNPQPAFSGNDPSARCQSARQNTPGSIRRGILVVENGGVNFSSSAAPLDGGIITVKDDSSTNADLSGSAGDLCVRGPVIVAGSISRQNYTDFGALDPVVFSNLAGFGGSARITQQSWRELYR